VRAMDLEQLRRDGYTVVEGVAGPEQIEPLLALALEASGVVLDDPSTWDPDAPELLELTDHQAQWDLRRHPPLHEAFAAAYGERDLGVSQDRLGVKVPGRRGMRIHHDVDITAGVVDGANNACRAPLMGGHVCIIASGTVQDKNGVSGWAVTLIL